MKKKFPKERAVRELGQGGHSFESVRYSISINESVLSKLVKRSANGKFVVNGKVQDDLVNKHPGVKIQKSEVEPKHFTKEFVADLVKSMKVA